MIRSFSQAISLVAVLALALAGCAAQPSTGANTEDSSVVRVGASPLPHAEILAYVRDNLAAEAGLQIEIVEFTDYVQPNLALRDGQIDANFFQHRPYMEDFGQEHSIQMAAAASVHVEPLGVYSRRHSDLAAVPQGATVAIPNDATNGGRALQLLAANGLIMLREGVGVAATVADIATNPKGLEISELEAAQLPRSLDDVDLAVINGWDPLESTCRHASLSIL